MTDDEAENGLIMPNLDESRLHPGRDREAAFNIVLLAMDFTLGDFVARLVFGSSARLLFEYGRLLVYYHDDRPYKKHLVRYTPFLNAEVALDEKSTFPIDYFNHVHGNKFLGPRSWYDYGFLYPHLLLTPSMMHPDLIPGFEHRARLRIPDDDCPALDERLASLGLDRGGWFAVIHYREGTYEHRTARPMRDHAADDFIALRDYIIDELGGQVVRLGHTGMTPFPPRDGFVDLSGLEDGFPVQAYAVSRARFAVVTPSGPASLCSAFNTPTGQTNTVESFAIYNEHDRVLAKHIITADGHRLSLDLVRRKGYLKESIMTKLVKEFGWRIEPNTREELFAMARRMHRSTEGIDGWRGQPDPQVPIDPPNCISLPLRPKARNRYIEFPDYAPPYPVRDE